MDYNKGSYGENIAEGYLEGKGYKILKSRYRCPFGEIDLIARNDEVLVFAEVKTRGTIGAGAGAESVTKAKQRRIIRSALHYISKNADAGDMVYRFDVLEVVGREFYDVNHIEDAFYAE